MHEFGWEQPLETGIEGIDGGQREIFTLINRTYKAACLHQRDEVEATLRVLIGSIRSHQQYEEGLLEVADYPDLVRHRHAHAQLLSRLERYFEVFNNGNEISLSLVVNLRMWLTTHILNDDTATLPYLQQRSISRNTAGGLGNPLARLFQRHGLSRAVC